MRLTRLAASLLAGALLCSMAQGASSVALADTLSDSTAQLLAPSALDDRLGDDGKTPVAVADGDQVYGARRSTAPTSADLDSVTGTAYFVDCSAAVNGDGSQASPFSSLDAANALTLAPGDAVLFKGGSTCTGTFSPQGSGSEQAPVTIDAYDAGADNRARIDASGAREAVHLYNVQHYTVRNLELTNGSADPAQDYKDLRRGLYVQLEDFGTGTGYEVSNLYVHDVLGNNDKASVGISFEVTGAATPTKFSGVDIGYNTVRHVNRTGIRVSTSWWQREEAEYWGGGFYPMDPASVHDNFLTDIGGDGIVVWNAPRTSIDHNTLENAANEHAGVVNNLHNAGIWAWVSDNTVISSNHVYGMHRSGHNNDGAAFDADTGGHGLVFEHNLSHDNEGGMFMYCGCWGLTPQAVARYNVSLNDGRFVSMEPGFEATGEEAATVFMAGATDSVFYNNTVLLPPTKVNLTRFGHYMVNNVVLANNLFLAQQGTVVGEETTAEDSGRWQNTLSWRHNVFAGPAQGSWPSGPRVTDTMVLPSLTLTAGKGLARVHVQDEALAQAGRPVADPLGVSAPTDFLGRAVPLVTAPDIGAFQLSPVPEQVTLPGGGFEAADAPLWTLKDASIVSDVRRSGDGGLRVEASGSAVTQAAAAINRTYRLTAAVRADQGALPQVSVTLSSGSTVTARPSLDGSGVPVAGSDGWTPVSLTFRTAFDATSVTVTASGPEGAGWVDDVVVEGVEDHVIDGSFEAPTNTVWQPAIDVQGTPANSAENGSLDRDTDAVTGDLAAPVPATGTRLNAAGRQERFSGDAYNRYVYLTPGEDYELSVWAKADQGEQVSLSWRLYPGWKVGYELTGIVPLGETSTTSTSYTRLSVPVNASAGQIEVRCSGTGLCDDMTLVKAWDGSAPRVGEPAGTTTPATQTPTAEASAPALPSSSPAPSTAGTEQATGQAQARNTSTKAHLASTGTQAGAATAAAAALATLGLALRRRRTHTTR